MNLTVSFLTKAAGGQLFEERLMFVTGVGTPSLCDVCRVLGRSMLPRGTVFAHGHQIGPTYRTIELFINNWCNKGCGMCCPVCGIVHNRSLVVKSSP